jgi:hypothetical protein
MKTGTSSLMDGKDYQQRKVMRIDDVNAMADSDIRENEQVEKLAEINYPMCEWAEEQCVVRRLAFINGYNKAKESYEVTSSVRELHQYKLGLEDGYNKAKETFYTEEQVLQLLLRLQQTESYDNLYEWFEQFKNKL